MMVSFAKAAFIIGLLVVGNLAAQRLLPTTRGDGPGRRLGYVLLVRALVIGVILVFIALYALSSGERF